MKILYVKTKGAVDNPPNHVELIIYSAFAVIGVILLIYGLQVN